MGNEINEPRKNRPESAQSRNGQGAKRKQSQGSRPSAGENKMHSGARPGSQGKRPAGQGTRTGGQSKRPVGTKKSGENAAAKAAKAKRKKINRTIRTVGRVAFFLQILFSMILVLRLVSTKMFPARYIAMAAIVIVILGVIALLLNLKRNRNFRIVGIVVSVIMIILGMYGNSYINRAMKLLSSGEESYKTDAMVVVVRADDAAEKIADVKDYTFGTHYSSTEEGNPAKQTVNDIQKEVKQKIKVKEYDSDVKAAQALLDGEVNAVIYSNAYVSVINDVIDDYSDKVKTIYTYNVKTDIQQEAASTGEPFNLLISGIDVYGDISQTSRSDVNIIMTINPKTKKILLTSTPRDYYVTIPGVSGTSRDKLTHAGIYGVDASMKTLENLYGIDITYYVRVNFNTLIDMVNALGGVDIYVEYAFDAYTDDYYFEKGWHHMDGDQALAFCRERYSFADGDNQRGRDQEQVLKAILEKMMSPAILYNASDLLSTLDGSFQTNMTESKIAELINMQLSDNASWDIHKQTAEPGDSELLPTYSGGSTPLYITWPNDASVKTGKVRIDMFMSGETQADLLRTESATKTTSKTEAQ